MKYILFKVIDKDIYYEYYSSNDLDFLKNMLDFLKNKYGYYFFIAEVVK